ncbi:hypothetical protein PVAND_013949 [Polypedilum vanderplanki]|uniref:Integrase catalytic domain-containing protein n=1 Tax=Polypedilum vanderplanki TaxID=319348 RepID=A0A9J6CS96_POLVA|nr:hypothetical protein PVAND_013949 [Polypedilum vanderplanki]
MEQEQQKAFEEIKRKLKEETVPHALFDSSLQCKLYTDASGVGLGAVLVQVQEDGTERAIMFASKSLTKTEATYPQIHREALAIVWAAGSWRLAPFQFKAEHISGADNRVAMHCQGYIFMGIEVRDTTSVETIKACESVFNIFGKPALQFERTMGTAFYTSKEFRDWCERSGIRLDFSVPLWPQHNGQAENNMKFINKIMRTTRVNMTNWRENLAKGVQFYNNERTHSSTNTSPAELMFGRRLRASLPILSTDQLLIDDDVREIDTVNKHLGKEAADKRRQAKESEIEVGDTVFMRARNTDKLAARFNVEEPCKIVKKTGATVVIETTKDGDEYRRNITAVKKNYNEYSMDQSKEETAVETEQQEEMQTENARGGEEAVRSLRDRTRIRAPQKLSLHIE